MDQHDLRRHRIKPRPRRVTQPRNPAGNPAAVYGLDTLPAWRPIKPGDLGSHMDRTRGLVWSGDGAYLTPPAIGARVETLGMGPGVVVSYFAEYGFLGVTVKLDAPPADFLKRVPDGCSLRFGAELRGTP